MATEDEITNTLELPISDLKILGFRVEDEDAKYLEMLSPGSPITPGSPLKRLHLQKQEYSVAQQVERMSLQFKGRMPIEHMSQEELLHYRLTSLLQYVQMMQFAKVRRALENMVHNSIKRQSSFIGRHLEEPKKSNQENVPPEYVKTLFQVFESELGELPQSIRPEILKLCRVK